MKNDLIGLKFNRLTVIAYAGTDKRQTTRWTCVCDCGNQTIVRRDYLKSGNTKSCGCLQKEGKPPKHGHARRGKLSPTHSVWNAMKNRCRNPRDKGYKNYGERGITVCDRWQGEHGFENFLADMGEQPKGLMLERIDNDKGYSPENCKWVTRKEQCSNTRRNVWFWDEDKYITMKQYATKYNISYDKVRNIRRKLGGQHLWVSSQIFLCL